MKFQNIDSETLPQSSSFLVKTIHRTSSILTQRSALAFASVTDFNIAEWRVASGLYAFGNATQKTLVDYTGSDQAQISRVLSGLEKQGMVRSQENGKDRRARDFELTEAGRTTVEAAMPSIAAFFQRIEDTLTRDEKETLISLLSRLLEGLEKGEAHD